MSTYDCMPKGLLDRNGLYGCSSSSELLWSLGVFNTYNAILSAFLGHDAIRRRIPSLCLCSKTWSPWSPLLGTAIHPIAMAASTITMRVNGFKPSIFLMFALWTMRPRMVATPIWYTLNKCFRSRRRSGRDNPYLWTYKDNIVEETVLNIFSLPFALFFVVNRHVSEEGSGACTEFSSYQKFWDSFYVIAAAGGVSMIMLGVMILHWFKKVGRKLDNRGNDVLYAEVSNKFWSLILFFGGLNILVAFAGQWLLWSTFISNAGTDFCPGSLKGEWATWALALFTIAIGRPLIGGPQ